MDIYVFSKAGPGLYYIATSPPFCGQVEVKLAELPTNAEPPFKAELVRLRGATFVKIQSFDLEEFLFQNLDHVIEGEVSGGILEGVVCNKKVRIKVASPSIEGPILGVVPVRKIRKAPPPVVYALYVYRLEIV
ncbi:MAG: hypothetical protein ABWK05_01735 [Pyrobaculum sp.]